ncbi:MAG TPA: hypothetical protein VF631_10400 [Allosphingosinicella sp.]|jgi:hypothetical protein|uniref:DUF4139 domain-containing protein n=1 Tax=Allosphingosinicella sp. TaxID=2823234 RepID=UPI002F2A3B71
MPSFRRLLIGLVALGSAGQAEPITSSPRPDAVSVTVYRAPYSSDRLDLNWLQGFALISERRQVSIPAGEGSIRFEGVAGGIIPESAIVTGLPDGVVEKNQDALLLSPASLLERSLGRRVHLRRTSLATGQVREHEAVIRSGAGGAVVLQTEAGFEALQCSGLNETIVYPSVPPDLSAKPTLSVRTRSPAAATANVTLSYLASGFDWQANYVATMRPDGRSVDLFAWVTLANGDETSFVNADTQAVAGRLNRVEEDRPRRERGGGDGELNLRCWAAATTSDIPLRQRERSSPFAPPPPPPPPPPMAMAPPPPAEDGAENIVVTGSRVARQETLGDLKLYRLPEPVTVAAMSQKQVAFLDLNNVPVEVIYRVRLAADDEEESQAAQLMLRFQNEQKSRLGVPLPKGSVALFEHQAGRPLLIGETRLDDKAVGEEVELGYAESPAVRWTAEETDSGDRWTSRRLTLTNANPRPVRAEVRLSLDDGETFQRTSSKLSRKEGAWLWTPTVPANGSVSLTYRINKPD